MNVISSPWGCRLRLNAALPPAKQTIKGRVVLERGLVRVEMLLDSSLKLILCSLVTEPKRDRDFL